MQCRQTGHQTNDGANMTELLDLGTRTYEYQRAQPALLVGKMSGLETAQLVLDGRLPTPPIITTLGISLVAGAMGPPALSMLHTVGPDYIPTTIHSRRALPVACSTLYPAFAIGLSPVA